MIRSLWTGTTGMHGQQLNIDVIANNLANVSTTGFKKSKADFQDLLYQTMKVPGSQTSADTESPTGIMIGLGVKPAAVTKIFTQGDLIQTENELDVAIEGNGFLQVEMPNGNTAYTRAGALKIDSNGRLTNSDGYPILPALTIPDGVPTDQASAKPVSSAPSSAMIPKALKSAISSSSPLSITEDCSPIGKNLLPGNRPRPAPPHRHPR